MHSGESSGRRTVTQLASGRMADQSNHSEFRGWVRERTLEVAHEQLLEYGWDQVRVSRIAAQVGVSRPTVYDEFGNKEGIAEALGLAETERFLVAIKLVLDKSSKDPAKALRTAVRYTFRESDRSPLLRAILTSDGAAAGSSATVLPLFTTRPASFLRRATDSLVDWFNWHYPGLDQRRLVDATDAVVRLTVSNVMFPGSNPRRTTTKVSNIVVELMTSVIDPR